MRHYEWDYPKQKTVKNPFYIAKKRKEKAEEKKKNLLSLRDKLINLPTAEEKILLEALVENRIDFDFQHILTNHKHGYIVDFLIRLKSGRTIIVECDGFHHFTKKGQEKDRLRDARLQSIFGYKVLRFANSQINTNLKEVLFKILCYDPQKVEM